jgi:hypothetical protein
MIGASTTTTHSSLPSNYVSPPHSESDRLLQTYSHSSASADNSCPGSSSHQSDCPPQSSRLPPKPSPPPSNTDCKIPACQSRQHIEGDAEMSQCWQLFRINDSVYRVIHTLVNNRSSSAILDANLINTSNSPMQCNLRFRICQTTLLYISHLSPCKSLQTACYSPERGDTRDPVSCTATPLSSRRYFRRSAAE